MNLSSAILPKINFDVSPNKWVLPVSSFKWTINSFKQLPLLGVLTQLHVEVDDVIISR